MAMKKLEAALRVIDCIQPIPQSGRLN